MGWNVGDGVGTIVGSELGSTLSVGSLVGSSVGGFVGLRDGNDVGADVGSGVGRGLIDGYEVGQSPRRSGDRNKLGAGVSDSLGVSQPKGRIRTFVGWRGHGVVVSTRASTPQL